MKKYRNLLGAVIAVFVLACSLIKVSYFYRGYTRLMDFYGYKRNSMDMVVIGTSVTFSSYIPMEIWEEYGISSCNYSTNVMFENSIKYGIRDVMKTQHPQLILVDIAPFLMESYPDHPGWDDDWRNQFISYNVDSRKISIDRIKLVWEINEAIGGDLYSFFYYLFDINRYHSSVPVVDGYRWKNSTNDNADRGYFYMPRMEGEDIDDKNLLFADANKKYDTEGKLSDISIMYLNELIKEVKDISDKKNVDIAFYCAPIFFVDEDTICKKESVSQILSENDMLFYDLTSESVNMNFYEDFWGHDHFDYLGAHKVTEIMYNNIISKYDIEDRREDSRYSFWNSDYEKWLEKKEEYLSNDIYRIEEDLRM